MSKFILEVEETEDVIIIRPIGDLTDEQMQLMHKILHIDASSPIKLRRLVSEP